MKRKQLGFSIVEMIVVIAVMAILVTITSIAYRKTQENARNETRKADVAMLAGALEEYRTENGKYPICSQPGGECKTDQVWQTLKTQRLIPSVPRPGSKAHISRYYYMYGSETSYGIYVPLEPSGASSSCKIGKNMNSAWWSNLAECSF